VPRTDNRKKRAIRFCGDCGYELAPHHDGPCPMCPRFEQLRMDFAVASGMAAPRAGTRPGAPGDWPPTPSEYRAMLAERRVRSTSSGDSARKVLRTPGLTQSASHGGANTPHDDVLAPPLEPKPRG
jgi:hypothetical protein